jgi:hypothetical protein
MREAYYCDDGENENRSDHNANKNSSADRPHDDYFFLVPYGLWFVGAKDILSSDAFL